MIDWNGDGKVDAFESYLTMRALEEDDKGGAGCCGPTVAVFLLVLGMVSALLHLCL